MNVCKLIQRLEIIEITLPLEKTTKLHTPFIYILVNFILTLPLQK